VGRCGTTTSRSLLFGGERPALEGGLLLSEELALGLGAGDGAADAIADRRDPTQPTGITGRSARTLVALRQVGADRHHDPSDLTLQPQRFAAAGEEEVERVRPELRRVQLRLRARA
jgi:hypothetical protein